MLTSPMEPSFSPRWPALEPGDDLSGIACVGGGGGAGDEDLRVMIGRLNAGAGVGAGAFAGGVEVVGAGEAEVEAVGELDSVAGVSNSTGRDLGVACTLVISLARLQ